PRAYYTSDFLALHPHPRTSSLFPYTTLFRPLPPPATLFPYTTLFRSNPSRHTPCGLMDSGLIAPRCPQMRNCASGNDEAECLTIDRKSTRLNSSHVSISYAVFCLKKKTTHDSRSYAGFCLIQQ